LDFINFADKDIFNVHKNADDSGANCKDRTAAVCDIGLQTVEKMQ
jgi:hypothetical protein